MVGWSPSFAGTTNTQPAGDTDNAIPVKKVNVGMKRLKRRAAGDYLREQAPPQPTQIAARSGSVKRPASSARPPAFPCDSCSCAWLPEQRIFH
eukprot:scaffold94064_cov69-Phaeocystis_antarctica.AAC.2